MNQPIVSAVIPTYNRPALLRRAVKSAMAQTLQNIEIIVIIDGHSEESEAALAALDEPRLRVLSLPANRGPAAARNLGIRAARAEWIAFLDDDDEWLPDKLRLQLEIVRTVCPAATFISCRSIFCTPTGHYCWPTRLPQSNEDMSEFLFLRRSLFKGEGLLPTPSLLVHRSLFDGLLFDESLRRHQDLDWFLRLAHERKVMPIMLPEALCIVHAESDPKSLTATNDWKASLDWARKARPLMTPKAYAALCLVHVSSVPAQNRNWRSLHELFRDAFARGKPTLIGLMLFVAFWIIPVRMRRRLRSAYYRLFRREKHLGPPHL